MAINEIYMAQLKQTWGANGEPLLMNFFYRAKDANGTAQALHAAVGDASQVLGKVNALQSQHVKNVSIRVINLFSLTDFYEDGINGAGAVSGNAIPAQDTYSFSLKLNTRGVSPGRKSISGIPVDWIANGSVTNSTGIAAMAAMATQLAADITGGDPDAVFEPVVVKRIKTLVAATETRPAYYKYNLPTSIEDLDYGKVVAAITKTGVGSMDTRQNGR